MGRLLNIFKIVNEFTVIIILSILSALLQLGKTTASDKRLEIESTFQRLIKIDPFEVAAYRALATREMFAKYILFWP